MPRIHEVQVDEAMTSLGGIASFAAFCRAHGIDADIGKAVAGRKIGPAVV
jgi:hypothetical protein